MPCIADGASVGSQSRTPALLDHAPQRAIRLTQISARGEKHEVPAPRPNHAHDHLRMQCASQLQRGVNQRSFDEDKKI